MNDYAVEVDISSEPGIVELPGDEIVDWNDDNIAESLLTEQAITNYVTSIGRDSVLGLQIGEAKQAAIEDPAEGAAGWKAALVAVFTNTRHTVIDTTDHPVELAAYWVDVAPIAEASTTLEVTQSKKSDAAASFKIAGIGGGPRFTATVKGGLTYTTKRRRRVVIEAAGTFQLIRVTKKDKEIGCYVRLANLDTSTKVWKFLEFPPDYLTKLGQPIDSNNFNYSDESEPASVIFEINRSKEISGALGLKLPNFGGIEASSELKISYETAAKMTYVLPARNTYHWATYDNPQGYIWTKS